MLRLLLYVLRCKPTAIAPTTSQALLIKKGIFRDCEFGLSLSLSEFDLGGLLQPKLLYKNLAHAEFLDFTGHRHRKLVHYLYVLRDLEAGDLLLTERPNFFRRGRGVGLQLHERSNFFPKHFIGNSKDLDFADARARIEEFFDFARVNVFAAPDDHVFRAADDFAIAVTIHDGKVVGVQPPVLVDGRLSGLLIVVVALHHGVPSRT